MKYPMIFTLAMLFFSIQAFSQTGTLRGTVYDDSNGETIPFATIFVEETSGGTTTDLDGAYELNLPAGTYNLIISYIGFADYKVTDVRVGYG